MKFTLIKIMGRNFLSWTNRFIDILDQTMLYMLLNRDFFKGPNNDNSPTNLTLWAFNVHG